jgi:hypothetical protein
VGHACFEIGHPHRPFEFNVARVLRDFCRVDCAVADASPCELLLVLTLRQALLLSIAIRW